MSRQSVNAAEMARAHGINEKSFRARLRRNIPEHHEPGDWTTYEGDEKHRLMEREAAAMENTRAEGA